MKKSIFITAVVLVAALFVFQFAFAGDKFKTVEGELVDTKCFVGMGAKGADHQECAVKCAEMGIPLGVLDKKGKVHVVLHITPGLAQYAGKIVRFEYKESKVAKMAFVPLKMEVKNDMGKWEEVKLPKAMM